jgi:hypothetical protein
MKTLFFTRSSSLSRSSMASRAIRSLYPCSQRHGSNSFRRRSGLWAAGVSPCDPIRFRALAFSTETATRTTESSPSRCTLCTFRPPLFTLLLPPKPRSTLGPGAGHCSIDSRSQSLPRTPRCPCPLPSRYFMATSTSSGRSTALGSFSRLVTERQRVPARSRMRSRSGKQSSSPCASSCSFPPVATMRGTNYSIQRQGKVSAN